MSARHGYSDDADCLCGRNFSTVRGLREHLTKSRNAERRAERASLYVELDELRDLQAGNGADFAEPFDDVARARWIHLEYLLTGRTVR